MSRGQPGGGIPVVEMLIRSGFWGWVSFSSLGLGLEEGEEEDDDSKAERIVFEASRQIVLSTSPMGARGLRCSLKAVGPMPLIIRSTVLVSLAVVAMVELVLGCKTVLTASTSRTSPLVIVRKRVWVSALMPLAERES